MSSETKGAFKVAVALFALHVLSGSNSVESKEICATRDGLEVCVQAKGPCDLYHLVALETSDMKMDMFHVSILNRSSRRIRISPHDFYGITVEGRALVVDRSLFDSIELKAKLRNKDLAPREQLEGFLFFPSCMGVIRALAHSGYPSLEVRLF